MIKHVAFLGIGLMGLPMAKNILSAGFTLSAWNRSVGKTVPLAESGAKTTSTAEAAVLDADIIITMVSDGSVSHALAQQLSPKPGAIWIDMSSTKPSDARGLAKHLKTKECRFLDAPVSGGVKGATDATLAIMVGGENSVFEACLPVLNAMGRPILIGGVGSGQLAKLANQAIVAITIGAVSEATLLLEKGGANAGAVRNALKGGFADSTILQMHGARMSNRDFEPGGLSRLQVKDLVNILDEAKANDLYLPMTNDVHGRFVRYCNELGGSENDHSGLFEELLDINDMK